jgi:hypothetical protein
MEDLSHLTQINATLIDRIQPFPVTTVCYWLAAIQESGELILGSGVAFS